MDVTDYRNGPSTPSEEPTRPKALGDALVVAAETPLQEDLIAGGSTSAEAKRALRQQTLARRRALGERERAAAGRRILERLLAHPELTRARMVLLYASTGDEVPTDDLARELLRRGKQIAYPKLSSTPGLMTLWKVRGLDALVEHRHGIRAPDVTRAGPVEPMTVDVAIVPGVAFTRGLGRLGRGGGYYDRLAGKLAKHCSRIGVCFDIQLLDALPRDPHDVDMHWVVTESTVYPFVPEPVTEAAITLSPAPSSLPSAPAPATATAGSSGPGDSQP